MAWISMFFKINFAKNELENCKKLTTAGKPRYMYVALINVRQP